MLTLAIGKVPRKRKDSRFSRFRHHPDYNFDSILSFQFTLNNYNLNISYSILTDNYNISKNLPPTNSEVRARLQSLCQSKLAGKGLGTRNGPFVYNIRSSRLSYIGDWSPNEVHGNQSSIGF